jgi:predicted unusual protein kinase regulating ubiquinone biosynthesis (AarF/ABC1/UbiB family)
VRFVVRLIKDYPLIRRRVDMQRVYDEFALVLRQELDYTIEQANNTRLGAVLAGDARVRLPVVHADLSTDSVLVMDWVDGISPDDTAALDAAGIDRSRVARTLLDIFFVQCFEHGVFHADPHPGNLVIVPAAGGGWHLCLLDLGAVATVPARLQRLLRRAIIAVATNDSAGTVEALDAMGMLMADADHTAVRTAIDRVLAEVFDRSVRELRDIDVVALSYELRDVFLALPFQLPQDVIYLGRALSLLSGVVGMLDPDIVYLEAMQPIAQRWLRQQQGSVLDNALRIGRQLLGVPGRLDRVLRALENGDLRVDMRSMEQSLARMERRAARSERLLVLILVVGGGYALWLLAGA